jgi:cell pole-organizing protein PopZ
MGDIRNEPSMEEILASIKRIIAEDGPGPSAGTRPKRAAPPVNADPPLELDNPIDEPVDMSNEESDAEPSAAPSEEVLELTEAINAQAAEPQDEVYESAAAQPAPAPRLVSDDAASASRDALAALSALLIKPEGEAASNTLEGLVREMLRPMLKEWLDARLPELVQSLVEKEIARISGRGL